MTKTKLDIERHRNDDDKRHVCRNKIRFKSIREAWETASFYYALYRGEEKYYVYPCTAGCTKQHYHLTTKKPKGNTYLKSEFAPPEYILDLYATKIERKNRNAWWKKLSDWLSTGSNTLEVFDF